MPSLRERIARRLFGDIIDQATAAAVSIRIDDSPGWDSYTPGPVDRPWSDRATDLDDALEAWRKNFLVRRIVTLTRSYVVGNGITVTSEIPEVDEFARSFWTHPENHVASRLGQMCDELTRTGELFPVLFTKRTDGMTYIRFIPASRIREIETDEEDYETELQFGQTSINIEPKWWIGPGHKSAYTRARGGTGGHLKPLMLHLAVNRPIGAVRGEGDLGPVLPWARRYSEWLKDRVRLNRQRTRQGILDVEIADPSMVQEKRAQLRKTNPIEASIYVHGPGETITMHNLEIKADDVKEDGRALRLAIATGAGVGLHYLSEGEGVNYATAKEMGEPTARFYTDRQTDFCAFLLQIVTAAYRRKCALGLAEMPSDDDLKLATAVTEVARADNAGFAQAAKDIVAALAQMKAESWVDDETAVRLAFKFAGEALGANEIITILRKAPPPTTEQQDQRDPNQEQDND